MEDYLSLVFFLDISLWVLSVCLIVLIGLGVLISIAGVFCLIGAFICWIKETYVCLFSKTEKRTLNKYG